MGSAMNTPVLSAGLPNQAPTGPDNPITASPAAYLMGAQANRLLSGPGFSGRVPAVMSKATYIGTSAGEVFGVSSPTLPAHTRMVLGNLDAAGLFPGTRVWTEGDGLRFENGTVLSLGAAPVWEGRGVEPQQEVPLSELGRTYERVVDESLASHYGENLGLALPWSQHSSWAGSPPYLAPAPPLSPPPWDLSN